MRPKVGDINGNQQLFLNRLTTLIPPICPPFARHTQPIGFDVIVNVL
ncbi:MAG TPA: hypothetical protein VJP83_00480 [Terriglobales bacterium]|nr:hypothetical protein [Terriglobales bacterium]